MSFLATTGGISGDDVRDLMVAALEHRFGRITRVPDTIEWLFDNGSCYVAGDTRRSAREIGLEPRRTAIHRADRPVRRVDPCRAQRPLDHGSNLIVIDRSRSAGTRLVKKTLAAILQKTATPLANRVFVEAELGSHVLARQAVRASQNDAASLR